MDARLLIEDKYAAIGAVVGFLLAVWLTDGRGFGVFALIAGVSWAVRRFRS
jgi:hypothetical protein